MIFEKLANGITKHAKLIVVIWVLVLIASIYPAMHSTESLSYSTSSMGGDDYESVKGATIMGEHFNSSSSSAESMAILLITYDVSTPEKAANGLSIAQYVQNDINVNYKGVFAIGQDVKDTSTGASKGLYQIALSYGDTSSKDIQNDTGNMRNFVSKSVSDAEKIYGNSSNVHTYVTGSPAISYDSGKAMAKDMSLVDPIAVLLILILVGLFFRSFVSSAAPPITIGVAFALVMCALFFLGQVLDIFYIVEMLLLVSMLGAGCDYCIFILARYREERRRGLEHIEASKQAIMWAGESVFTSGLAVMIGFGSMVVCDFNIVSTLGIGLAIGIVFALLAALTLMSSLVVLLGDRLFWPSGASSEKHEKGYLKFFGNVAKKYFAVSTRFSIKHAKAIIVAVVLFTVPMVYVYANSENSYDMIGAMMTGESADGMTVMTDYVEGGSIMPNYAVIQTTDSMGTIVALPAAFSSLGNMGTIQWSSTAPATIASINGLSQKIEETKNPSSPQYDSNIGTISYIKTWDMILAEGSIDPTNPANTFDTVYGYVAANMVAKHYSTMTVVALQTISKIDASVLSGGAYQTIGQMPLAMLYGAFTAQSSSFSGLMDYVMLVQTGVLGSTEDTVEKSVAVGSHLSYAKISMSTVEQAMSNKSIASVNNFTKMSHEYVDSQAALNAVWISGTAAVMVEISNIMTSQFLKIEITAMVLIVLLLFFVMKSYLTPIRSVVTILMSVVWTVAITQLLFTDILHAGVLWMLPIILLVICLGLGMDYDILLTTRIREYRFAKGMSNDEAIENAVSHSGSVITICGFIMAGTFGTMMLSSTVMLQQMGFALCFAILVDALIVRTYIVPAAMHLMGEWNWKGPFRSSKLKSETDKVQD